MRRMAFGVLAVHCGPGLLAAAVMTTVLINRRRAQESSAAAVGRSVPKT